MVCENCGNEHNGTYGSGRFCSSKCARGFSTKAKRKEINEKVGKKLKKEKELKICLECGKEFKPKKKNQKFCSRKCSSVISQKTKEIISKKMKGVNAGSKNGMYGKTPSNTKRIKVFSDKHIKNKKFIVKSSYEAKFVDIINCDINIKSFVYEPKNFRIKYKDENGISRTYLPDFLINNNQIIEIKNKWSANLPETILKAEKFKKTFEDIDYKIIIPV